MFWSATARPCSASALLSASRHVRPRVVTEFGPGEGSGFDRVFRNRPVFAILSKTQTAHSAESSVAAQGPPNAFLATTYWPAHHAQFALTARAAEDFHRVVPSVHQLDQIFHLEETRVVGLDWVVRYHNRVFQLARQSGQAPARSTVTVCEWEDGRLAITYRGQPIRWTEGRTAIPSPSPRPLPAPRGAVIRTKPAATHPWRRGYENLRKTATLWQAIKS